MPPLPHHNIISPYQEITITLSPYPGSSHEVLRVPCIFVSNIPYFIKKSLCETNSLICNLFCFAISINSLKFTWLEMSCCPIFSNILVFLWLYIACNVKFFIFSLYELLHYMPISNKMLYIYLMIILFIRSRHDTQTHTENVTEVKISNKGVLDENHTFIS